MTSDHSRAVASGSARFAAVLSLLLAGAAWAADGVVSDFAGNGRAASTGDGGAATGASLNNPFGVVRGPDGAIYTCEYDGQVIRRIDDRGTITTVAGSGRKGSGGDGGPALEAEFNQPHEVRFDAEGNLFVADMQNHRIRRVDGRTRLVTTVAGTGQPGFSGDGGLGAKAQLRQPHSIQFDGAGLLYICDIGNHRIRRWDPRTGVITTFAGNGERGATPDGGEFATVALNGPRTLDFDRAGGLWVALREGNQVFRLDPATRRLRHVAGTGAKGFTGNGGPARSGTLSGPKGLAVGPDGRVFLADTESHSVRVIDPATGTIDVVVGTGEKGDGPVGPGQACRLARPHGVFVDRDGRVFIGDSENHRVRVAVMPRPVTK